MNLDESLIIDNFAGGGGASTGIEMALGRSPDVAINHDAEAVALHAANHPDTMHLCQNVWKADPVEVVRQASAKRCGELGIPFRVLPVAFAWFSPDCKHFSKAKGSKPVEKGIRDLAWVVVHWVRRVRPDVIGLENVEEFKDWGPLIEAEGGKLVPCPVQKGLTFKRWVRDLKRLGYKVETRELRACDYGAPTIRKRLFVVARRDGKPIVWPKPTHAKPDADGNVPEGMLPWRTAAECIDWDLPCPSIFTRERDLAENTLRRIARGIMRYVVNADRPFIVGVGGRMGQSPERPVDAPLQTITAKADSAIVQPFIAAYYGEGNGGKDRTSPIDEPLRTATVENRFAVVEPFIARIGQTGGKGKYVNAIGEPVTTITSKAEHLIVEPLIAPLTHHGGDRAHAVDEPLKTVTAAHRGEMALIAPHVTKFRANSDGHRADEPLHTITANSFIKRPGGAAPLGLVSAVLTPRYGERVGQAPRVRPVDQPMASVVPTQNGGSLAAAYMAQHNTGMVGHPSTSPVSTIAGKGANQALVAALLSHAYTSNSDGGNGDPESPAKTITAGGTHHGLVQCDLSDDDRAGAERVSAFIAKYYSAAEHGQAVDEPLHTVTSKPRFGLVTVLGWPIVDIGMRMLQPPELYRAQGFPSSYVIAAPGPNGKPLTKTAQVRMCGNSVCPPLAQAITFSQFASNDDGGLEERAAD